MLCDLVGGRGPSVLLAWVRISELMALKAKGVEPARTRIEKTDRRTEVRVNSRATTFIHGRVTLASELALWELLS